MFKVTFNTNQFPIHAKEPISKFFTSTDFLNIISNLDYSTLEEIYITGDFGIGVQEVCSKYQLTDTSFTNSK